jgi:hypothetical protein
VTEVDFSLSLVSGSPGHWPDPQGYSSWFAPQDSVLRMVPRTMSLSLTWRPREQLKGFISSIRSVSIQGKRTPGVLVVRTDVFGLQLRDCDK